MTKLITLTTLALALAFPAGASAATCGSLTASNGLRVSVVASNVGCMEARRVASTWSRTWARKVRSYSCRVTREATGTDPGFEPYTYARCQRGRRVIKMKLAS